MADSSGTGRASLAVAILSAVALVLALAAPAALAGGWTAPVTLENGSYLSGPAVATAADGTTVLAWYRYNGTRYVVTVSMKAPGGAFSAPQAVSDPGVGASGIPAVAIDGTDVATVAWNSTDGVARASTHRPGSDWTRPATLSAAGVVDNVTLATSTGGATVASWQRGLGGGVYQVEANIRQAGAANFNGPLAVSPTETGYTCAPSPSIDDAGDVAVAWNQYMQAYDASANYGFAAFVTSKAAGDATFPTTFPGRAQLTNSPIGGAPANYANHSQTCPVTRMTHGGHAFVLYNYNDANGASYTIHNYVGDRPARWTAPTAFATSLVPTTSSRTQYGLLAAAEDGSLTLVYDDINTGSYYGMARSALGVFGGDHLLTGAYPNGIALGGNAAGNAVLVWGGAVNGDDSVLGALKAPGADFAPAALLAEGSSAATPVVNEYYPNVGVDDQGNSYATWYAYTGSSPANYGVRYEMYDNAPPALSGLSVPAAATAGQAVTFSVAASDRVSGATVHWDFGDGTGADGATVTHTYGAAANATVTVTATDGVGNAASRTAAIAVTAAPTTGARTGGATATDNDHDGHPAGTGRHATFPDVRDGISASWTLHKDGTTVFTVLTVTSVRSGDTIKVACSGGGCRRSMDRTIRPKKIRHSQYSLLNLFRGHRLHTGARVTIKLSRRALASKIVTLTIGRTGVRPRRTTRCLDPGARRTRAC
jgi:hypothetical protein